MSRNVVIKILYPILLLINGNKLTAIYFKVGTRNTTSGKVQWQQSNVIY